jgi:ssDNA-binding Zn-finger/Zn-ribbon topoisomerase 1
MNTNNLIYANREADKVLVSISEVESGLKCGCVCPSCGEQLIAKKGKKKAHHFAHYKLEYCEHGYQTSLHMAAKEILLKAKKLSVPSVELTFETYKKPEIISEQMEIQIDNVKLEKRMGDVIPDVIITSGGRELFLEIYVTHKVDEKKKTRLRKSGKSTIEIDLSKLDRDITEDELTEYIIHGLEYKTWVYNRLWDKWKERYGRAAEKIETIKYYGESSCDIEVCPLGIKQEKNRYTKTLDCLYCPYCFRMQDSLDKRSSSYDYVECLARSGIEHIDDFKKTPDERAKSYSQLVEKFNIEKEARYRGYAKAGKCPRCGAELTFRDGKHVRFIGCTGYPHCKFTYSKDLDELEETYRIRELAKNPICPKCGKTASKIEETHGIYIVCMDPKCKFLKRIS